MWVKCNLKVSFSWKICPDRQVFSSAPGFYLHLCVQESFLHIGNDATKEFHSCILLERKKLWSAHFPDITFFGISRCCTIREPFTMPFSVFLFPFAVNLAKSIFRNTEMHAKRKCVFGRQKQAIWLALETMQCNNTPLTTWARRHLSAFLTVFLPNFPIPSWNKGEGH